MGLENGHGLVSVERFDHFIAGISKILAQPPPDE
jgi:hypothetical protein